MRILKTAHQTARRLNTHPWQVEVGRSAVTVNLGGIQDYEIGSILGTNTSFSKAYGASSSLFVGGNTTLNRTGRTPFSGISSYGNTIPIRYKNNLSRITETTTNYAYTQSNIVQYGKGLFTNGAFIVLTRVVPEDLNKSPFWALSVLSENSPLYADDIIIAFVFRDRVNQVWKSDIYHTSPGLIYNEDPWGITLTDTYRSSNGDVTSRSFYINDGTVNNHIIYGMSFDVDAGDSAYVMLEIQDDGNGGYPDFNNTDLYVMNTPEDYTNVLTIAEINSQGEITHFINRSIWTEMHTVTDTDGNEEDKFYFYGL